MMKKCFTCKLEKDISFFTPKSGRINQWRSYCKDCSKKMRKQYYAISKNHEKEVRDIWYSNNKDRKQAYEKAYRKERYASNPKFRLSLLIRIRLGMALKYRNIKYKTSNIAIENLGCTTDELRDYLEKRFQVGMSWDNWGQGKNKWHIDHIKPLN